MSVLHIAEVSHLANDSIPMPPLTTQAVTYTTSSVQSAAFNPNPKPCGGKLINMAFPVSHL